MYKVGDKVCHKNNPNILYEIKKVFLDGTYRIEPLNADMGMAITAATEDCLHKAEIITIKQLHLPLKAKWFNMQESGEKTEEYREITPYWCKRLLGCDKALYSYRNNYQSCNVKGHTHVLLRYGYTQRCIIRRIDSISIGRGNPEWGAPLDRDVFIIKHHKEDLLIDGWKIHPNK